MNKRCLFPLLILAGYLLAGCSTTLPEQSRKTVFASFVNQPEHWLFYWPSSLTWEDNRFGSAGLGQEFSDKFDFEPPVLQLMRDFSLTAGLPGVKIMTPKEAASLSSDPDTPVLYFTSSWALIYRRMPPNLFMNKLRMGVVAKVIPLGQVVAGKGPIALRTSAWEGRCTAEAFDGNFFSRDEWEAGNGVRLKQGLQELQAECGGKLAAQFAAAMIKAEGT
ncbi:hypothetical protein [Marinobacterium rhizophilum]|uniref:hypothetical protein n=1 Tax=Marinobacterium rhizophilum TaxID=420402 RepID=UPI000476AE8F|nr:hypothetical protein [Marinobacterium rhizophilum]